MNTDYVSQEFLETVERFINNTMSKNELQEFEAKLQNPEFKTQVDDIKTLILGIEAQALKEQLDIFYDNISVSDNTIINTSKVISFPFRKLVVAAVIVIALGSFWFFNQTSSNEKLYSQYFSPDPGLPTTMGETANFEFYDAMVNYKQGDYKTAISKWETLLKTQSENDTLNYFLGVAHLANNNYKNAIKHLDFVIQNTSISFKNEAHYYLGLAYLKADNLELAKKNLTFSTTDNSKTLLSKLND